MKPISTGEHEVIYAKNQSEYLPLPACLVSRDGHIATRWRASWRERLRVLWSGDVWVEVLTFNHPLQPLKVGTQKPLNDRINAVCAATPAAPLLARLERLNRLATYADHTELCDWPGKCTCGYEEAREALAACGETDATQKR